MRVRGMTALLPEPLRIPPASPAEGEMTTVVSPTRVSWPRCSPHGHATRSGSVCALSGARGGCRCQENHGRGCQEGCDVHFFTDFYGLDAGGCGHAGYVETCGERADVDASACAVDYGLEAVTSEPESEAMSTRTISAGAATHRCSRSRDWARNGVGACVGKSHRRWR